MVAKRTNVTALKVPTPITPQIKAAILKRRGGLEDATDEQLTRIWLGLSEADRKAYLEEPHAKGQKQETQSGGSE